MLLIQCLKRQSVGNKYIVTKRCFQSPSLLLIYYHPCDGFTAHFPLIITIGTVLVYVYARQKNDRRIGFFLCCHLQNVETTGIYHIYFLCYNFLKYENLNFLI